MQLLPLFVGLTRRSSLWRSLLALFLGVCSVGVGNAQSNSGLPPVGRNANLPRLWYYLVDKSQSIRDNKLQDPFIKALVDHIQSLSENTEVRIVFFDTQAQKERIFYPLTDTEKKKASDYIKNSLTPGGGTKLFDTVAAAAKKLSATAANYDSIEFVFLSDGDDRDSVEYKSWAGVTQECQLLMDVNPRTGFSWITAGFKPKEKPGKPITTVENPSAITIPQPKPSAEFVLFPSQAKPGESVHAEYTNKGGVATEVQWNFGDGSALVVGLAVDHQYTKESPPEGFTVTAVAVGPGGRDTKTRTVRIVALPKLMAVFRFSPDSPRAGEKLYLQDISEGSPERVSWQLNGAIRDEKNPVVEGLKAGSFPVTLVVKRGEEVSTTKTTIDILPEPPVAGFTLQAQEVIVGDLVNAKPQLNQNGWQHSWVVGGGSEIAGDALSWKADRQGMIEITHIVKGRGGRSQATASVHVGPPPGINPGFSISKRVFTEGDEVQFKAAETKSGWAHTWKVGDRSIGTGPQVAWKSDLSGTITITHEISVVGGQRPAEHQEMIVGVVPELIHVQFDAAPRTIRVGETVNFTDRSTGPAVAYNWNFGDRGSSSVKNPSHVYNEPGEYPVVLKVTNIRGVETANVESISIRVLPPPPAWIRPAIAAGIFLLAWVFVVVPLVLRPLLGIGAGVALQQGMNEHRLARLANRGIGSYFWPRNRITIGYGRSVDIPLTSVKPGEVLASIRRVPLAKEHMIQVVASAGVQSVSTKDGSKRPITGNLLLRSGDLFEVSGQPFKFKQ